MKYNQPYGISDPNAAYINGNPSTGTMGSIPPAASIEYPQREIVNFETYSGLVPDNADLAQLGKSVQSGKVNYALDQGTTNHIVINPTLPITTYKIGLRFLVKMGFSNTSHVDVNVSNIGLVPLVHFDSTPVQAWELLAGQMIEIAYDGANFQMLSGGAPGGLIFLNAPRDLYVNGATGSDTAFDGTSAVVSGGQGPFKTVAKALAQMQKYNLAGWDFNIHVADSTYNSNIVQFPTPNGSGRVNMIGNNSNPLACQIINNVGGSCFSVQGGGTWTISGFYFAAPIGKPGDPGNGIWISGGAGCISGALAFGATNGAHMQAGPGGSMLNGGPITIYGGASSHEFVFANGVLLNNNPSNPALTIVNASNFSSGFCKADGGGQIGALYSSFTGYGLVTGPKYSATANGVVSTGGSGASYLPGNSAGATASGGQYV